MSNRNPALNRLTCLRAPFLPQAMAQDERCTRCGTVVSAQESMCRWVGCMQSGLSSN